MEEIPEDNMLLYYETKEFFFYVIFYYGSLRIIVRKFSYLVVESCFLLSLARGQAKG